MTLHVADPEWIARERAQREERLRFVLVRLLEHVPLPTVEGIVQESLLLDASTPVVDEAPRSQVEEVAGELAAVLLTARPG